MKYLSLFFLTLVACVKISFAQKSGLINSGEVIKRGVALYDSGQYKKALIEYDKISRSDTNYVSSLYEKAMACEADSQFTQAIKYCKEGLALKEQRDNEPDFYNVYGNILNDSKQYEEALKLFNTAIAKYPSYALLYFNKGITYVALKRLHDAELMFQQTLLINPYMYSAHYQMGLVAMKQGQIIPAFLSFMGYLVVNPGGKYAGNAIGLISKISKSTDDILELKSNRTTIPDANYQQMEDIISSKIALDKAYKPIIALDDELSRQMQVLIEKLEYSDSNNDFYIQYYLPYYKQVYNQGKFELFVNQSFSNVKVTAIQDYVKRNKKALDVFLNEAADYFNLIRATRELQLKKRGQVTDRYFYENGKLIGKGAATANNKSLTGPWTSLYAAGNIKGNGTFSATGEREGQWLFYFRTGKPQSKLNYINGKMQGVQEFYQQNGVLSSIENYVDGKAEGLVTTYFYCGNKKTIVNYKLDKKNGEERDFHSNGVIKLISNYANDVLNGPYKEYYKSGQLKETQQYVNGKSDGPYKSYYESGALDIEGVNSKDNAIGEWKYYYENGKIKEKRNYVNNNEEGLHQEYYDNGQLSEEYSAKKDKINGNATYYSKDGKVYSKYIFDNGIIKSAKYYNPAGTEISSVEGNGNNIITYTADGVKKAHPAYDKKGNVDGPDTIFYPSGKIEQVNQYKAGQLNGNSITYYLNGKKKSEINMTDGKDDGYYTGYYTNGQTETEGWMREGESEGEWIYYDELGNITSKAYYQDDELHGYKEQFISNGKKINEQKYHYGWLEKMTQFDTTGNVLAVDTFPKASGKYTLLSPAGKITAQGNYVNGDFNGDYKTYFFDGSVETSVFYKNGLLDSSYVNYYYGGKKYSEGKYLRGGKTGTWKYYDEDGKLYYTAEYVNDALNGEELYYNPDGSKDVVSVYKDDLLNGLEKHYDPDGSEAYEILFEDDKAKSFSYLGSDGKLVPFIAIGPDNGAIKSYFQNGKISRDGNYSNGVKNGTNKIYYSNGQLRRVTNTIYGIYEGLYKEYYADGKPKSDYNYLTDNVTGICHEYNKNGTLKKEVTYVNGTNQGPVKYFDENGKLTKTLWYNYGKLIAVKNEK